MQSKWRLAFLLAFLVLGGPQLALAEDPALRNRDKLIKSLVKPTPTGAARALAIQAERISNYRNYGDYRGAGYSRPPVARNPMVRTAPFRQTSSYRGPTYNSVPRSRPINYLSGYSSSRSSSRGYGFTFSRRR